MGLRINTNVSAIGALRTLRVNDRNQARSLERLSTGLRINRGADDPSGLVISEQLRVQLSALNQAVDNSQNASNLISVADAALQETSNLLTQIQDSIVFAQNTGGSSPDQIAAEQDSVDQAINAIDRIAATTRFADRPLLNGSAEFQNFAAVPDFFDDLVYRNVSFTSGSFTRSLVVSATVNPQRASILLTGIVNTAAPGTLRITGERGTEDVVVAASADAVAMTAAINAVAGFTGVYASGSIAVGGGLLLRSEEFGSAEFIKVEVVSGTFTVAAASQQTLDGVGATGTYVAFPGATADLTAGEIISDQGRDGEVSFEGQIFTGIGRRFSILSKNADFSFNLDPDLITSLAVPAAGALGPPLSPVGPVTLTVANTGLNFQLNELPLPTDQLGVSIAGVSSSKLGLSILSDRIQMAIGGTAGGAYANVNKGGFLNTIKTGAGNDLVQNPNNASNVVKAAVNSVAGLRGFLGAVQAFSIEPNIDALGVSIENLSASLSDLRDLDFAEETSNFTRSQILFQSGIAVLASANLIPQSILTLLS